MVWYWAGPDFLVDAPTDFGLLWGWGALDFAGGTVVHINAGIAGLVGCLIDRQARRLGKEATPPHSLTMTMIGASLLWVGWFGFNAGSNLEANGLAALAFINTFVATAAAGGCLGIIEQLHHGKPSLLGAVTRCGCRSCRDHPGKRLCCSDDGDHPRLCCLGVCYLFVAVTVKNKLKYDDTLDVFGVHCGVGGIVGAIGTAIVADPALGGQGFFDYTVFPAVPGTYDMAAQLVTQFKAVGVTVIWTGVVSAVLFYALKFTLGLRPSEEAEREGLDLSEHGERAYNY
jgi:Amt family ammonium transporter